MFVLVVFVSVVFSKLLGFLAAIGCWVCLSGSRRFGFFLVGLSLEELLGFSRWQ